ncbi:MAG: hypothetical protein HOY79_21925 [Streptomyces sp.]|nr:hypothetical protein [Streptomyces sp.]
MTITFATSAGPLDVDSTESTPGLHICEAPADMAPTSPHRWILTHHTGWILAAFDTADAAERCANAVAPLADWTRQPMTCANEISLGGKTRRLLELITDHGGHRPA